MSSFAIYTYNKPIKNITLLMSTINPIFKNDLDSYDYDTTSSTLSFSFKNSLTPEQKLSLDTLINIYVDSTILTPTDIVTFKNIRAYKSSDQTIPTTINSTSEVLFKSTSCINRLYYQMSSSGKYIYIQKPGLYYVIAKVGARLTPGSTPGSNSVVQWGLSYDDARTEIVYMNISNTFAYTCHTNVNAMTDSTLVTCIFNVNSATGTYLRLTAKRTLGNTPLIIDNDQTTISILSIPGASFYEGNMTTSLTLNSSSMSNINLNSDRIVQYPFTHTVSTPNVTINQTGNVLYIVKSTINKTSGSDQSYGRTVLTHNGTPVPSVGSFSSVVASSSNKTTSYFIGMLSVENGDQLSIQGKIEQGSSLQFTGGETGMILIYIHPSILKRMTAAFVNSDVPQSNPLTTSPSDILFNKKMIFLPSVDGGMSLSGSSSISVLNPGLYLVFGNVTISNNSGIVRECGVHVSRSTDGGKTFYYAIGTLGIKQVNATGKTTIANQAFVSVPSGSKIKLQVATNGLSSDNIFVTDTTQFTVINFNAWEPSEEMYPVFGDNFNIVTSNDDLLITSATHQEKCRLIYHYMGAGVYRFTTNMAITTTTNTNINIQIIDIHSESSNTYILYNKTVSHPPGTIFFTSTDFSNIAEGAHHFILQISSPDNVSFTTRNVTIDCWRVI